MKLTESKKKKNKIHQDNKLRSCLRCLFYDRSRSFFLSECNSNCCDKKKTIETNVHGAFSIFRFISTVHL